MDITYGLVDFPHAKNCRSRSGDLMPHRQVADGQAGICTTMKILLVDDSKSILRENERVLREAGYEVVCAEDGQSALDLARKHKPDLILLDMILPKMSGPDVLDHLKHEPATASIPVVVLSSLTEKKPAKACRGRGGRVRRKKHSDADEGSKPVAEDSGERDLPDQPQTGNRLQQRPDGKMKAAVSTNLMSTMPLVFFRTQICSS
jgi:CheY-like chemotaxis protein